MNNHLMLEKSPPFTGNRFPCVVPVLIKVPLISITTGRSRHQSAGHLAWPRRRRRLRREIRVIGYTLVTAVLVTATLPWKIMSRATSLLGFLNSGSGTLRVDHRTVVTPPLVSISVEPLTMGSGVGSKHPVVLPGYLLPDESPDEEMAHGGY